MVDVENGLIELRDGAALMTHEERNAIFCTPDIMEENQALMEAAKVMIKKYHVPSFRAQGAFIEIAQKRNYFFVKLDSTRAIFIHISRFSEILQKVRNIINQKTNG